MHPPDRGHPQVGMAAKGTTHSDGIRGIRHAKHRQFCRPMGAKTRRFHRSRNGANEHDAPQPRWRKVTFPVQDHVSSKKLRPPLRRTELPELEKALPCQSILAPNRPRAIETSDLLRHKGRKHPRGHLCPSVNEDASGRKAPLCLVKDHIPRKPPRQIRSVLMGQCPTGDPGRAHLRAKAENLPPPFHRRSQPNHGGIGAIGHDRAKLFSSVYRRSRRKESKGEVTSAQGTGAFREEPSKNRLAPRGTEHGGKPGQPNRRSRLPRSGKDRRGKHEKNLARTTTPCTTRRNPAAETGGKVVMHPAGHGGEGPPRESRPQAGFCHRRGDRDQLRNLTERALHPRRPGLQPCVRETGERANPPNQRGERIRTGSFSIHFGKHR